MTAPHTTEDAQRLLALVTDLVTQEALTALEGALLGAGLAAALEEERAVLSPRALGTARAARKAALLLLAERREVFYASTAARLVRALARESRYDVDAAWLLLCESMDMIVGLEAGDIDPVQVLGAGVPGSVQDKRMVLESDAEADAQRALGYLLATACPPRRGEPDPVVVSLASRRQLAAAAGTGATR